MAQSVSKEAVLGKKAASLIGAELAWRRRLVLFPEDGSNALNVPWHLRLWTASVRMPSDKSIYSNRLHLAATLLQVPAALTAVFELSRKLIGLPSESTGGQYAVAYLHAPSRLPRLTRRLMKGSGHYRSVQDSGVTPYGLWAIVANPPKSAAD